MKNKYYCPYCKGELLLHGVQYVNFKKENINGRRC